MKSSKNRVSLEGSERTALPGARVVGAADPNEHIEVTVLLRRRTSSKNLTSVIKGMSTSLPNKRTYLKREEFAAMHGADPDDIDKVKEFANEHGLDVVEANEAQRRVVLSGTVAAMSEAFGVNLEQYESPMGKYRGRKGPINPPEDIASIIEGVFGLDNRPQARPHMRPLRDKWKSAKSAEAAAIRPLAGEREISYTPPQLAQLYNFPEGIDGSGQCIGIIELDGGYSSTDLETYFTKIGITKPPEVSSVSVDAASNEPTGDPNSADGEVMLDIEVAGAVAPGAKIVVYFAPNNTDRGFLDAVTTAIHDTTNKPFVISISWGNPEAFWTEQAMRAMDNAFKDAAALGVTVCCAAGDNGSSDIRPPSKDDGLLHVDFPSSSPYVLACGGTRLEGSGSDINTEGVWNEGREGGATGGGVSDEFDLPGYQANANVPLSQRGHKKGRGVPDVAGDADPRTGYQVLVDGQWGIIGGTSAVAPLWAGLIALLNQELGKPVGFLNEGLYKLSADTGAFHVITSGDNDITGKHGLYQAGQSWNPCTGLGSPDGAKLLSALSEG